MEDSEIETYVNAPLRAKSITYQFWWNRERCSGFYLQ
jgi:hypothetical protein